MTYISLYRKWRSQTFEEVVGQDTIIQTIKNAIKNSRIAHAYLFSGPRGTGKTSTARIFAKALNCESGPTVSPCGKCDRCVKIRDGHALDVIEIDAASNRGIDEIRDLREKVRYAPVEGRYKVYIIDEVHMLTSEAFNALLKTLEEPPKHVIFILATTEPQRVPLTILSRCQRLDFKRIPYSIIVEQLKQIVSKEQYSIEEEALNLVARNSEGSLRDAISLLDQLISFCDGKITHDDVAMILGTAGADTLFEFGEVMGRSDTAKALDLVNKSILEGKSVPQVTKDILEHFRHILLIKLGSEVIIEETAEHVNRLKKQADLFTTGDLQQMIKVLSRAETDMKWHPQSRLVLEVAMIEICSSKSGGADIKITERKSITAPERHSTDKRGNYEEDKIPVGDFAKLRQTLEKTQAKEMKKEPSSTDVEGSAKPQDLLGRIKQEWPKLLDQVKQKSVNGYISLHEGTPVEAGNGRVVIEFKKGFAFHKFRLEEESNKIIVKEALKNVTGEELEVSCIIEDGKKSPPADKNVSVKDLADIFGGRIVKNP